MNAARLHHINLLAEYNRWMNQQLYAVCSEIPDAERKRDMKAYFRSIHGTFNHLLLVDRLWMGRLTETPFVIDSLAQELHSDFVQLQLAREQEDLRIARWVSQLTAAGLDRVVDYISALDRQPRRFRVEDILLHLYHHQTHHRGQITTLISQLGYDFGETGLAFMPGMPKIGE